MDLLGQAQTTPEATYIISYPKSGNTWMRFILSRLNFPNNSIGFNNIQEWIPDSHLSLFDKPKVGQHGTFLKSHTYFTPKIKKVIYIVRDPRSVAVSYYHQFKRIEGPSYDLSVDQFVKEFISGSLDSFGTWGEHTGSWIGARYGTADFALLKYEDLLTGNLKNCLTELQKLAPKITEKELQNATEETSFKKMRSLEAQCRHKWKDRSKEKGLGSFIRRGSITEWQSELSNDSIEAIEQHFGPMMKRLNYI